MNNGPLVFLFGMIACALAGCSTIEPAQHFGTKPIESYKTAYIVMNDDTDDKIGGYIQQALTQHGVQTTLGPVENKPKDTQFYVNFVDHWKWDMTMYLYSLDVRFLDNASGTVIANSGFKTTGLHGFPDPKKTAFEVIDKIYAPAGSSH